MLDYKTLFNDDPSFERYVFKDYTAKSLPDNECELLISKTKVVLINHSPYNKADYGFTVRTSAIDALNLGLTTSPTNTDHDFYPCIFIHTKSLESYKDEVPQLFIPFSLDTKKELINEIYYKLISVI